MVNGQRKEPAFWGRVLFMGKRLTPKETICRGQRVLKGNAARWAANPPPLRRRNGPPPLERADIGLGPWTHCLFEYKGEARVLVIRPLQGRGTGRKAGGGLGAAIPGAVVLFAPALGGPDPNDRRRLPDSNAVGARRRQARPGRPGGCVPLRRMRRIEAS